MLPSGIIYLMERKRNPIINYEDNPEGFLQQNKLTEMLDRLRRGFPQLFGSDNIPPSFADSEESAVNQSNDGELINEEDK